MQEVDEGTERYSLSSGHFSHDNQVSDVMAWLSDHMPTQYAILLAEFPEWTDLPWEGSWAYPESIGLDMEYMSWLCDSIEMRTPVYWEDGEPWIAVDDLPWIPEGD